MLIKKYKIVKEIVGAFLYFKIMSKSSQETPIKMEILTSNSKVVKAKASNGRIPKYYSAANTFLVTK